MNSPAIRIDLADGQTGEVFKRIPLDYGNAIAFENWPVDGEARAMIPTPGGYPLEIRIRRIL